MELLRRLFKFRSIILILSSIMAATFCHAAITSVPTSPDGPNGSIQINRKGVFMGYSDFVYSTTTKTMTVSSQTVNYIDVSTLNVLTIRFKDGSSFSTQFITSIYPATSTAYFPFGMVAGGTSTFENMTLSGNRPVSNDAPSFGDYLYWDSVSGIWRPGQVVVGSVISVYPATATVYTPYGIASTTGTFTGDVNFTEGEIIVDNFLLVDGQLKVVGSLESNGIMTAQDVRIDNNLYSSSSTLNLVYISTAIFNDTAYFPYGLNSSTGVFSAIRFTDGTVAIIANIPKNDFFVGGAGNSSVSGFSNVGLGGEALKSITSGSGNTAVGNDSLYTNQTGEYNTAIGAQSLTNVTGSRNTAVGYNSLYFSETGSDNTALGFNSGYSISFGTTNVAVGSQALYSNATGYSNTALGYQSLWQSDSPRNTAVGMNSGYSLIAGSSNTFIGFNSGNNPLQKADAVNSMSLGAGAYTNASNQIVIGNSNIDQTILRGNVYITTVTFPDGSIIYSTSIFSLGNLDIYNATATVNMLYGFSSTTGTFSDTAIFNKGLSASTATFSGQVEIASLTWTMGAHKGYLYPNWQTGVTIRPPADPVGGGENPSVTLDGYLEDNISLKFKTVGSTGTLRYSGLSDQFTSSSTWAIGNVIFSTITFSDGTVLNSTSTLGGGSGGGATNLDGLTDVTITAPAKNQALLYNGSVWVNAAQGTSFTFAISAFTNSAGSNGTVFEIGTGNWKAIGAMSFSASYSNGPATNGYVSHSGWSNLTLGGAGYVGPTTNTEAATFPSVGGTKAFTLNATDGSASPTSTITYYFYNRRFWGVSSVASGYTEANVEGLANNELSNSKAKTFTITANAGEYIIYAYPSRLGTASFFVGGFLGGFTSPETVSVTNGSGYSENYYVYRSLNQNLGNTEVTAQ